MKYLDLRKEVVRLCVEVHSVNVPIQNVYLTTSRKRHICHAADQYFQNLESSDPCDSPKKAIANLILQLKYKRKASKL